MSKIVWMMVFFVLSGIFLTCKKDNPKPDADNPFDAWTITGETSERLGPGYAWRLSTERQTDPSQHIDLTGSRLLYLNPADNLAREVTLTVTKREESSIDPTFRIYGRFQQCLQMSAPITSSGESISSGIFQRAGILNDALYSGISWTPALGKSPVNSKATLKFKVFIDKKDTLCAEGFVQVDMIIPAAINSAGSYLDGDHLYFIRKNN